MCFSVISWVIALAMSLPVLWLGFRKGESLYRQHLVSGFMWRILTTIILSVAVLVVYDVSGLHERISKSVFSPFHFAFSLIALAICMVAMYCLGFLSNWLYHAQSGRQ